MVEATDHVKHIATNLFGEIKRLKASLKKVELEVRVVENAREVVERALGEMTTSWNEATTLTSSSEAKLGQALSVMMP